MAAAFLMIPHHMTGGAVQLPCSCPTVAVQLPHSHPTATLQPLYSHPPACLLLRNRKPFNNTISDECIMCESFHKTNGRVLHLQAPRRNLRALSFQLYIAPCFS
eukprot:gb/GEZJ01007924.1/.p2 GENE.gb/GEZJ01007924.1/~~gb/GEZJ01007924.1/.p2  ORF type:complete len:104 (+),score=2.13 gb/GEZJ01007924.1/:404-715(+)